MARRKPDGTLPIFKVEEDYQVCARMLEKEEGKGQRRKGKA